ncbi:MAG: hypothetical protein NWR51_01880 [Akkermansiaceae bacterium]|jgi:uncharacterized phage infection (PIP) family protein YhgE|nr:hypothetical protein [Akkermansiaceae bacterium]MDP4996893.1 hypothetical protein [Akkermansiaceae bacterium]
MIQILAFDFNRLYKTDCLLLFQPTPILQRMNKLTLCLAIFSLAASCFVALRQSDTIEKSQFQISKLESKLAETEAIASEPLKNDELVRHIKYIRYLITEHEARRTEDNGSLSEKIKQLEEESSFQAAQDVDLEMKLTDVSHEDPLEILRKNLMEESTRMLDERITALEELEKLRSEVEEKRKRDSILRR